MTDATDPIRALAAARVEYGRLGRADADTDPDSLFTRWYAEARDALGEPNAMVVSTLDEDGPSARIVLLKAYTPEGFVFFTGYESAKGRQIAADARVSLVFPWHDMQRQVRVRGVAEQTSEAESDAYFAVRPRGAQLAATASRQSAPTDSREQMERAYAETEAAFAGRTVTRPENWGGFRIRPWQIEFWQGQANRFHDRFVYTASDGASHPLDDAGGWTVTRLEP